jgi:hypothetical protein
VAVSRPRPACLPISHSVHHEHREPPINRLRPSHRPDASADYYYVMHRTQTCSPQQCHFASRHASSPPRPSRDAQQIPISQRASAPRDHHLTCVHTTPPPAPTRLPSYPRPSAHFSALFSLHLLAREAAQASIVPARRAESFERDPPFRSPGLGSAIRISKEGKPVEPVSTAQRKTRQCTDLSSARPLLVSLFLRLSHNLTCC